MDLREGETIAVGILAGGASRRFGGQDKAWVPVQGRPMIEWTLQAALALKPCQILLSANRNLERYQKYGMPVLSDAASDEFLGPLAGMSRLLAEASADWVLFLPCDAIVVPPELASGLLDAARANNRDMAVLTDGEQVHPTFSLIHSSLAEEAMRTFKSGERSPRNWFARHGVAPYLSAPPLNLNTPESVAALESLS